MKTSNPTGSGPNTFQLIYHPIGTALNDRTGAGFAFNDANGDQVILTGHTTTVSGNSFTSNTTEPRLDQAAGFPTSNNPPTVDFSGSTRLVETIDFANPAFFPDLTAQLTNLAFFTQNVAPFQQVGANSGTFFDGTTRNIGATNGLNGPDVEFQTDGNTALTAVCVPLDEQGHPHPVPIGGQAMLAESTGNGAGAARLTEQQLQSVVNEAIARWAATGLNPGAVNVLQHVPVSITDLPGTELGLSAGGKIWISRNAAGWGWFTDPTSGTSLAPGQMDLLTVIEHELGHTLGFEHSAGPGLMEPTLAPGVQLAPTARSAFGSESAPSTGSSLGVSPLNNQVGALTTSNSASSGGSVAQSTALPTQPSAQVTSPAGAPGILSAIGSTPILVVAPSSTTPSQTPPVPSGRAAATTDGIAAVPPSSLTVLMPLPPRVDMRLEGDGDDPVLRDRTDSDNGESTDQSIPIIHRNGIPEAVPAAPAAPVEEDPSLDASWLRACETYLEDEEWAGWFMSRDKAATPAQGEDESLNQALEPIAGVAAFAVALSVSGALASQAPDCALSGPTVTAQPKTSATKRRPWRLSRWFSLCLGRRA